jgi:hypothetical protein
MRLDVMVNVSLGTAQDTQTKLLRKESTIWELKTDR